MPASTLSPVQEATVDRVSKSSGSAMASVTVWSCSATGRQRNWRRNFGESVSVSGDMAGGPSMVSSNSQLFGQRAEHVARGDESEIDQNLAELVVIVGA